MRDQKFIKTRERIVRYSMSDFIKAVHARPQLWERHNPDYHHRDKRELSWQEVATCLYSKFNTMSETDKHKTVVMLTKRWKNTRDSFFRSIRRNRMLTKNNEHPRAYIYEKELSFLLDFNLDRLEDDENEAGIDDNNDATIKTKAASKEKADDDDDDDPIKEETLDDANNETSKAAPSKAVPSKAAPSKAAPSKKKRKLVEKLTFKTKKSKATIACDLTDTDEIIDITKPTPLEYSEPVFTEAVVVKEAPKERSSLTPNRSSKLVETPNSENDPDQSFFDSIKPVIRNMSMDQKLDFQIEVLKLLKDYRGKL